LIPEIEIPLIATRLGIEYTGSNSLIDPEITKYHIRSNLTGGDTSYTTDAYKINVPGHPEDNAVVYLMNDGWLADDGKKIYAIEKDSFAYGVKYEGLKSPEEAALYYISRKYPSENTQQPATQPRHQHPEGIQVHHVSRVFANVYKDGELIANMPAVEIADTR
jgi:hypothetical protein